MLCKILGKDNPVFNLILIIAGVVAIAFGIWYSYITPEDVHHLQMLAGMFTGMGSAFLAIGVLNTLRCHFGSAEKRKQREIERNDERNVQITRYAMSWAAFGSVLFSAVLNRLKSIVLAYALAPATISFGRSSLAIRSTSS